MAEAGSPPAGVRKQRRLSDRDLVNDEAGGSDRPSSGFRVRAQAPGEVVEPAGEDIAEEAEEMCTHDPDDGNEQSQPPSRDGCGGSFFGSSSTTGANLRPSFGTEDGGVESFTSVASERRQNGSCSTVHADDQQRSGGAVDEMLFLLRRIASSNTEVLGSLDDLRSDRSQPPTMRASQSSEASASTLPSFCQPPASFQRRASDERESRRRASTEGNDGESSKRARQRRNSFDDMNIERGQLGSNAELDIVWSHHETRWKDLGQLLEEDPFMDKLVESLRRAQMNTKKNIHHKFSAKIPEWHEQLESTCLRWLIRAFYLAIDMDSAFLHYWNLSIVLVSVAWAVIAPLLLAFQRELLDHQGGRDTWLGGVLALSAPLVVNMIVSARTTYIDEGHKETASRELLMHYLKTSFALDLCGSIPFELLLFNYEGLDGFAHFSPLCLLRLLLMIKSFPLFSQSSLFHQLERYTQFNPGVVRLFFLLIMFLLVCHWAGCLWWYSGSADYGLDGWGPPAEVYSGSFGFQYMYAFFWGVNIISGVNTMDVVPETFNQTIVTTTAVLASVIVMGAPPAPAYSRALAMRTRTHRPCTAFKR